MRRAFSPFLLTALLASGVLPVPATAQTQSPQQFFGFALGTDGEMARYPKVVEYLEHLAGTTRRVTFEELGKTTMGNRYVLAAFSSPENLARLDRLVEINRRLADPRGLSEADAAKLAAEGRPFYLVYATIHSTEVGNGQAIPLMAHRLATEDSPFIRQILDDSVVLMVPSQNPDGQVLVIDHWYKTKGTNRARQYPDLYHKYTGHDNNRDWFMLTQVETRLMVEKVQNRFKPVITHDMHQQGPTGSRIFVPPFDDPYDPNIHPILAQGQAAVGMAMASALTAQGKEGVEQNQRYDLWTPARQYMVYHGQPRILTEIASANIADPFVNPAGKDRPLGPQESRWYFIKPYTKSDWRLGQIVDYSLNVALAGMSHVAKYHTEWLHNFYRVHRDWSSWTGKPYAFVVPAGQRDPFAAYEMLDILRTGEVELHRATAPFTAGGTQYPAGSVVVKVAQPYGAFAKTLLEKQVYPDLRLFPGGPPKPPYDVTGHTLWMLMGVDVASIDAPFEAPLEPITTLAPEAAAMPARPRWGYLVPPESNGAFRMLAKLQAAKVPVFRAAAPFEAAGRTFAPGTWMVAPTTESTRVLADVSKDTGLRVFGADRAPGVDAWRLKPETRIGLLRGANNMPGGWMMWLFEQYGLPYQVVSSQEVVGDLAAKYDTIVLPTGVSKETVVRGLDPQRYDKEWEWAYGAGEEGWNRLREWVKNGGTLVAIGTAVETVRELLDLPIEKVLPESSRRRRFGAAEAGAGPQVPAGEVDRVLRETFSSPANLLATLRDRVADPASIFYCPGSLLQNEFDTSHPVAYGMPEAWPIFFESDQAYRLRPGFGVDAEIVARYPKQGEILKSGWLLGEDLLRDQANVMAFRVGKGYVVAAASQIDFRTQPRATFKLLFNAMFHGPSQKVTAAQLVKAGTN
jgi:hypothetical protein